jgi:hypothetical protein
MTKTPSLQHRCRLFFESAYEQKKGVKYYYAAKDASALKQVLGKIKFLMPQEEQNNEQKIEDNFQAFINTILFTNQLHNTWIIDNLSLSIINSKFNEIYSQLTHGTTKQPSAADIQRAFGSRNITPDILDILT